MKKSILFILLTLAGAVSAFGQATQPCVVRQYNQEREKTPLPGVEMGLHRQSHV